MPPRRRFTFDDRAGRYRATSGRFLPASTVRSYIDRTLDAHARAVADITEQFRARAVTLGEWERRMRAELKAIHLYSGMAAKGGRGQLTQADFGRIGARLKSEYALLRSLADDVASGKQPIDGRLASRARMYAQAGRGTFHLIERVEMEKRGFDREENILAPADHCAGCLTETERGAVRIGSLVPIGQRDCLSNDRCRIRYSNSQTGEVAA